MCLWGDVRHREGTADSPSTQLYGLALGEPSLRLGTSPFSKPKSLLGLAGSSLQRMGTLSSHVCPHLMTQARQPVLREGWCWIYVESTKLIKEVTFPKG